MMQLARAHRVRLPIALSLLVACGGEDGATIDAGSGSADARPTDAAPVDVPVDAISRVSVTVLTDSGDGEPDTSANVIFVDPDHQLVKQGLVGTRGEATADLPRGGLVHVLRATESATNARRVAIISIRVQPGDNLTFGVAAHVPQGAPITVTGSFTQIPGVSTNYEFYHPCGSGFTSSVEINVARLGSVAGCLPETFDVLGMSPISGALQVPRYVWFSTTPDGGFLAPAMQEMPAFAVTARGIPSGNAVAILRTTVQAPYFNDVAPIGAQDGTSTGVPLSASLFYPPSSAALGVVQVVARPGTFDRRAQVIRTRLSGTAAALDVDFAASPLPSVSSDPVRSGKVVSWTQTGTGHPDLREVTAASIHVAGGWTYTVAWTVLDDSIESSLELPGLPAMFAEVDPTQQLTSTNLQGRVVYVDYSNVDGFDSARQLPLGSLTGQGFNSLGAGLFGNQLYSVRASMY